MLAATIAIVWAAGILLVLAFFRGASIVSGDWE